MEDNTIGVHAEDILLFKKYKEDIREALKKHGSIYFMDKSPTGFVGLANQGATCYLNSLLQALYLTPEVRERLFAWQYTEGHSTKERSIPLNLQRLFARLQMGSWAVVETRELTHSFGWTAAESFRQHDVQELCRVLFDALEQCTEETMVDDLYQGEMVDYIKCMECGNRRERKDIFMDIELPIEGLNSLESCMRSFCTPEILSEGNQWMCEKCDHKVDAEKGLHFCSLPPILTIHLKRFVFDMTTLSRVKLNHAVSFPIQFDMSSYLQPVSTHSEENQEIQNQSDTDSINYELFAVLIHSGTAMGGHYHAIIRSWCTREQKWSCWLDFNDSSVREVSSDDLSVYFGSESPCVIAQNDLDDTPSIDKPIKTRACSSSNAYVLFYRRTGWKSDSQVQMEPSEPTISEIKAEIEQFETLKKIWGIHQQMAEVTIFYGSNHTVIDALLEWSVEELLIQAANELIAENDPDFLLSCIRLRHFSSQDQSAGQPLDVKNNPNMKLKDVIKQRSAVFMLETKAPHEEFSPYNPNEYRVMVSLWNPETKETDKTVALILEGDQESTLYHLKTAIHFELNIPIEQQRIVLLRGQSGKVLMGDESQLKRDYNIWSSDHVVIEIVDSDLPDGFISEAISVYEEKQNIISMHFNLPENSEDFNQTVKIDKRLTLLSLKNRIAEILEISNDQFILKRSARSSELRNLEETLIELNMIDGSFIFVELGTPLKETEHLIHFYLYLVTTAQSAGQKKKFELLGSYPVDENILISELKEKVSVWIDHPANCIRIRDKTGAKLGAIFRNDKTVKQSHPLLREGTEFAIQKMKNPETLTSNDIVVSVRLSRPLENKLTGSKEIILNRKATLADLQEVILFNILNPISLRIAPPSPVDLVEQKENSADQNQIWSNLLRSDVGIARAPSFGPPLTVSGVDKLKWNEGMEDANALISAHPLSIREGSVIVVRNEKEARAVVGDEKPTKRLSTKQKKTGSVRFPTQRVEHSLKIDTTGRSDLKASKDKESEFKSEVCVILSEHDVTDEQIAKDASDVVLSRGGMRMDF